MWFGTLILTYSTAYELSVSHFQKATIFLLRGELLEVKKLLQDQQL